MMGAKFICMLFAQPSQMELVFKGIIALEKQRMRGEHFFIIWEMLFYLVLFFHKLFNEDYSLRHCEWNRNEIETSTPASNLSIHLTAPYIAASIYNNSNIQYNIFVLRMLKKHLR